MWKWARIVVAGIGVVAIVAVAAVWVAGFRWERRTGEIADGLIAEAAPAADVVSFEDLHQLPAPVARYFRYALREGQPVVRSARVVHEGQFQMRPGGGWSEFESTQQFSAGPPGFVWDAAIDMAPLLSVRVRDSYVSGTASMQGSILALIPVVDERGRTELNAGALQRYLAESAWLPTALLSREGLEWTPIDDERALATLTDGGTTVSLEFRFNEAGEITSVFAPDRYYEADREYLPMPWAGRFWGYEERGGMMVPMEAEVEWRLPEEDYPYWRARIVDVQYQWAQ